MPSSYSTGLKRNHLPPGVISLEVQCLRDGTLDVDLKTGDVFTTHGKNVRRRKLLKDKDGYLYFKLARESRRGKEERDRGRKRKRRYRYVRVNRLVMIKKLAVAAGEKNWRLYCQELPRSCDVNHVGARDDNRAHMLELQTERINRAREQMTQEEADRIELEFV